LARPFFFLQAPGLAADNHHVPVAVAALGGLIIGSFLNVVAYRLPRRQSLVSPGSRCPGCGVGIKPYDNIPIIGWLLLRGTCRACGSGISLRYPAVEALTGVLAASVVLGKTSVHDVVLGLVLIAVLVPIALVDLEHRIIPNRITLPAATAAIGIGLLLKPSGVPEQLIAGLAAGGFLLLFALAYPRGMGMGDVKLAAVLGLFLGRDVGVALLVAVVAATGVGMVIMAKAGVSEGRKTAVPFGPFLAFGGMVALFAGGAIVHWYLHSLI
jgi:leader peptidase (prepilin peptidase)/N-methyltransferase